MSDLNTTSEQYDKLHQAINGVHAEIALLRTEIRAVASEAIHHQEFDEHRFGQVDRQARSYYEALHSDIRELKERVLGVEDTGRNLAVTDAQAMAALDAIQREHEAKIRGDQKKRDGRREWLKLIIAAFLAFALGILTKVILNG